MELTDIKGLGPTKIGSLRAAGIGSVEELAGLDLRRNVEVSGITPDGLKALKARARKALQAEGRPVPKAPYHRSGKAPTKRAAGPKKPVTEVREKPGFLRRLLSRQK